MVKKPIPNPLQPRPGRAQYDLGRLVAEEDKHLQDYYVGADCYVERALSFDHPACFFVGPKGIGKSAILSMVRQQKSADLARIISISPDALAFSSLPNIAVSSPLLADASKYHWLFRSLWDYVLSLEILQREYPLPSSFYEKLVSYLNKWFGSPAERNARRLLAISLDDKGVVRTLSDKILQLIQEIEVAAEVSGVSLTAKLKPDNLRGQSQFELLQLINSVAKSVSDHLTHNYHILVDDLDLSWQDEPIHNQFIGTLFQSVRHFSKSGKVKFNVAMRDHIFKKAVFQDRDKFHDWICNVEWDADTIRAMIEKRVVFSLKCGKNEVWGVLFPGDAFARLWSHSTKRPRELIRMATLCIREARKSGHTRIEDGDIKSAVRKFSEERIDEVADEWKYVYSGLDRIIRKFAGLHKEFSLDQIQTIAEDLFLEVSCGDPHAKAYPWAGGFADDSKGFARILLECGILLFKVSRTDAPRVFDPDYPPNITSKSYFAVHPMFAPALGLIGA